MTLGAHGDSTAAPDAFPELLNTWIASEDYSSGAFDNQAKSGKHPFDNAVRLADEMLAINPDMVVFPVYQVMDADVDLKCFEAIIRRIWTARPTARQMAVLIPIVDAGVTEVQDLDAVQTSAIAILHNYGIPYYDFRAFCIANEGDLATYMANPLHPTAAGQEQIKVGITDYWTANPTFLTDDADHSTLPARVTDCADYEQTPQRLNPRTAGTETGTGWADVGTTGRESSTAGDTIAFTATFTNFGFYRLVSAGETMDVDIDGGGYNAITVDTNGYTATLGRAEHTVTFRVRAGTTLRIDEFWAI